MKDGGTSVRQLRQCMTPADVIEIRRMLTVQFKRKQCCLLAIASGDPFVDQDSNIQFENCHIGFKMGHHSSITNGNVRYQNTAST